MIGTRPQGQTGKVKGVLGVDFTGIWAHSLNTDAHVFFVQPNSVQATDNGNTGEDPQTPFATVGAALLRCQENRGDTILVGGNDAWTYGGGSTWNTPITEDVTVSVEGVHIIGVTADPLGVPWQPATDGGTCCAIQALGVEVAGFCFQDPVWGAATGISTLWDGAATFGENAHIHDCFFYTDLAIGIQLEYSWNNLIADCIFQEVPYGIYCDPAEDGFAYNVIERCQFHDCSTTAIEADAASCDDNLVRDCDIFNASAQAGGAATEEGFNFGGGADNTVRGCFFSCVLPGGGAGDWDDLNTASGSDSWCGNWLLDGFNITNPT